MNELGQKIYSAAASHNKTDDLLKAIYNLDSDEVFDLIVIAPSWLPEKIMKNYPVKITTITRYAYFGSYLVEYEDKRIAWIQTASGANNLIDSVMTLGKSSTEKVVFIGAVGALKPDIDLGELCTPSYSLAFEGGSLYTYDHIDVSNFGKKVSPDPFFVKKVMDCAKQRNIKIQARPVYCTDSVICEYMHLERIKSYQCDLIEMETAAFYRTIELIGKKGIALLVVSDNSASGVTLISRTEEQNKVYYKTRETVIPELIFAICGL